MQNAECRMQNAKCRIKGEASLPIIHYSFFNIHYSLNESFAIQVV